MAFFDKLRRWKPRDRDTAERRNQAVDRLQELTPLLGTGQLPGAHNGDGIYVKRTPLGTILSQRSAIATLGRLGVITDRGPSGQADFEDSRYWVRFARIDGSEIFSGDPIGDSLAVPTHAASGQETGTNPASVAVTNLPELFEESHSLPTNNTQAVWCIPLRDSYGQVHWIMSEGGTIGSGQYQGMVYQMVSQNQTGWQFTRAAPIA